MRVNKRFAAADGNHRRVAFLGRPEAILQTHHILERGGIFPNSPATGAGEITGMQRLELQHRGELLRAAELMPDHVRSDFSRKRQGKPHKSEDSNEG